MTTSEILKTAAALKATVSSLSTEEKNNALAAMADAIEANKDEILSENALDLADAEGKISPVMLDRLRLADARVHDMANGVRALIALPDPVGKTLRESTREDGLLIRRISVPLGVVAIIYESRPNVTADAAALCFKSGNVCVLRGGKEAYRSSHAIVRAMQGGLTKLGLDPNCVQILTDVTHDGANELMRAVGLVDLLIPRGGARLIRACVENALVPCIETGTGICHIYVDNDADPEMALNIIENAKTSRPSVCNAAEVCLVGAKIAPQFLPMLQKRLVAERTAKGLQPVELRLDQTAATIIPGTPAGNADFDTEFLDYVLAVAVVEDTNAAIAHIAAHSTHHSEAIITKNTEAADRFTRMVDSAAVYVNASTRFTDGGEFGLGCEMGISTQKLHARGPMGLEELTAYHYVIEGKGHIR
ncbi:MAG: glutamate-5-semialdehyde dehydrogenase [Oscillospiraceae bacterium]|nr:glutamate-5-semialdehyde dehydrogenase [Oscillospiraceae bacterium]MBR3848994.1 glutamate-5-semialdehyde dehydrogenase [Oscillospiraceae bacterium]